MFSELKLQSIQFDFDRSDIVKRRKRLWHVLLPGHKKLFYFTVQYDVIFKAYISLTWASPEHMEVNQVGCWMFTFHRPCGSWGRCLYLY